MLPSCGVFLKLNIPERSELCTGYDQLSSDLQRLCPDPSDYARDSCSRTHLPFNYIQEKQRKRGRGWWTVYYLTFIMANLTIKDEFNKINAESLGLHVRCAPSEDEYGQQFPPNFHWRSIVDSTGPKTKVTLNTFLKKQIQFIPVIKNQYGLQTIFCRTALSQTTKFAIDQQLSSQKKHNKRGSVDSTSNHTLFLRAQNHGIIF